METRFVSDNDQFVWDLSRKAQGVATVDSPRTKAVVGFIAGRQFELGGVVINPGKTRQDWCTVACSLIEGDSFKGPGRVLIVATGYAENTAMGWTTGRKDSVDKNWGKPPSLVEVVPVTISLPVAKNQAKAWALDERGQRQQELAAQADPQAAGRAVIELGPPHKTLLYEVEIK